jgi:2-keto-4-pentenoate hydratase/2-oxohepta-3-ene-1,7-dioic acid hydratase in catechol pathway
MKIGRAAADGGSARLVAELDNSWVAVSDAAPCASDQLLGLLQGGPKALESVRSRLDDGGLPDLDDVCFLPPLQSPEKILAIGMNYRSHVAEVGAEIPREPTVFSKFNSTIIGDGSAIHLPLAAPDRVDYEAELAVVIGRECREVPSEDALDVVAGYMVANDVTARDWQLRKPGGQWLLGKTFDTFLPLGPYLVTSDEVPDPHRLSVRCTVSGELLQDGNTSDMIFRIPELIEYISKVVTLRPGDIILTGTPAGIGAARTPRRYLKDGDMVETRIDGLGMVRNTVTK